MSKLFLSVFNVSVMGVWAALIVFALRLIFKKAPAWFQCALWGIVGLRLVWPFRLESNFSLIPSTQTLPADQLYDAAPQLQTGFEPLDNAINPAFTQVFGTDGVTSVNPLQIAIAVAANLWIIGIGVMAVYALVSWLRLRRQTAVSVPVRPGVYICDKINTPFILGIVRPRIYLPSSLPEENWESILAHEYAHLKRRDHWWKPLGFALLAVHWFNPVLWLAYILLCRDIEVACDQRVIRDMTIQEKQAYSETLLRCSMETGRVSACPLAFGETGVKQRIKELLHYKKPTLWIIILAVLVGAAAAVCFLTSKPVSSDTFDIPRATWFRIKGVTKDQIYAVDFAGNYWQLNGTYEGLDTGDQVWVTYEGDPQILEESPISVFDVQYAVKPTRLWSEIESEKLGSDRVGRDIGYFDIDSDGVAEECIIAQCITLEGFSSYELTAWDGDVCEISVQFYSQHSGSYVSFFTEEGKLKLLAMDFFDGEVVYDIGFADQRLTISQNGIEVDYKYGS